MQRHLTNAAAAFLLALSAIMGQAPAAAADGIMIVEAFARASATPVAKAGAAYVSVMNHGSEADRLVAVSSPVAKSALVHQTEVVDGVMKMLEAGPVEIAPMATLEMKPGGLHIMLMGLSRPLRSGEEIDIALTFEKAGRLMVRARVGGVAEGGHDHGSAGGSGG